MRGLFFVAFVVASVTRPTAAEFESLRFPAEAKASAGGGSCSSELDCQLNGICENGFCRCDAAWRGSHCYELALQPAKIESGIRFNATSTWGGNMVRIDQEESEWLQGHGNVSKGVKTTYHFFYAEMAGHCGLKSWTKNSLISRAVADNPLGPFRKEQEALPIWAHNPQILKTQDGKFLLFHIGSASGQQPIPCSNGDARTPCKFGTSKFWEKESHAEAPHEKVQGKNYFPLSVADSVYGPWKQVWPEVEINVGGNANPTPVQLKNGTFLIVFHSFHPDMALLRADHWAGPYKLVTANACGDGEDPYLFVDKRGHFHCLAHALPWDHPTTSISHSYSLDGFTWHVSKFPVAGSRVLYENGKQVLFSKRERPKLVFNDKQEITHLISGVTLTPQCTPDFLPPLQGLATLPAECEDEVSQYKLTDVNPCPGMYDRSFTLVQAVETESGSEDIQVE